MQILRNEKIRKYKNMIFKLSYWKWILGSKNKTEIFQGNILTIHSFVHPNYPLLTFNFLKIIEVYSKLLTI